ncbi:MAG TPA: hypothetical protein VIV12_09325 [Streptosporangiaceae bacterium]
MITPPNGKPIDSLRDQYEWKALLAEAGSGEARRTTAVRAGGGWTI